MRPSRCAPLLIGAVAATALAGCGGGGGGASADPNSSAYDPAKSTLQAAGLEVCSEDQNTTHTPNSEPGLAASRTFLVARDCHGAKTAPNSIIVFQFTSRSAIDAGAHKVEAAYPRSRSFQSGPLLVLGTGPDSAAYLKDVQEQLQAAAPPTTTG